MDFRQIQQCFAKHWPVVRLKPDLFRQFSDREHVPFRPSAPQLLVGVEVHALAAFSGGFCETATEASFRMGGENRPLSSSSET